MKKIILSAILGLIIISNANICQASELNHYEIAPVKFVNMPITVNGKVIAKEFYIDRNTMMLPVRAISEALGYTVGWDEKLSCITVSNDTDNFRLCVSQDNYEKNDGISVMGNPLTLYSELSFAPSKFFEQSMSVSVLSSEKGINIIMKIAPVK